MSDRPRMLIYGANGYTGRLIVEHVVALGMKPVLAGRNVEEIPSLAQSVGLEWRVVDLSDPNKLDEVLLGMTVVIHCAGPFSRTYSQWRRLACARRFIIWILPARWLSSRV